MKRLVFILLLIIPLISLARDGSIAGTVIDDETGETLVGVTVLLDGTSTGTATDPDGQFSLEVSPGTYDLRISYISYQTLHINGIEVTPGKTTRLEELRLKEDSREIGEVVVKADVVRNTESALNTIKQQSAVIMDGISASAMKMTGDNTAVEAARRVTGVTVEDGKYVYVRGLGDRYSKVMLNNVDIPGLDPDKNSLQMDIFPTNLIDNMLVSKNFTADLPADFTGGLMNIETKDLPKRKFISVSASTSYNPDMHFNSGFLSYNGGSTDFLGFDDCTRRLPVRARLPDIPTPVSVSSVEETNNFVRQFNPNLAAVPQKSFIDYSLSFTLGNQIDLLKSSHRNPKLGYIFSLSYRSDYDYFNDVVYGEYQRAIGPQDYEMRYSTLQQGKIGEHSVLIGMMGGLALTTNNSKVRLTGMRLQNGINRAGKFTIDNNGEAVGQSGYLATSDNLEYNQRSLTHLLLNGNHRSDNSGWELDWRISPTFSTSEDPDIRKTAFTHRGSRSLFMAGAGGNPARIWRYLAEVNTTAKFDVTKRFQLTGNPAKIKFGASHNYKERDYEILFFDMQFFGSQNWPEPDPGTVLNEENIFPNKPNSIYYQSGNTVPNSNAYRSDIHNTAAYVSGEITPFGRLTAIAGLRAENYVQRHTGRDQRYASGDTENGKNLDNEKVLDSFDFFPSINLKYALRDNQNLRASYSRTIARPSFKELSFAQILDPISNRIFNGSLFSYPGWDGNLTETRINNLDLRWEMFMDRSQILSLSAFYKHFDDPIELVRIPEQQTNTEYQPRNVGDGRLFGIELDFRKNLSFVSPELAGLTMNGNVTFVDSQIDMTEIEYNSRKTYEKEGESIRISRQMAGQSPYVVNTGLVYSSDDAGFEAGAFYNVKGPTLSIVGAGLFPDIYSNPYHSLNISASKHIGKSRNTTIDFKVSNVLDSPTESYYHSYNAQKQIYSSVQTGRNYSLGISYRF